MEQKRPAQAKAPTPISSTLHHRISIPQKNSVQQYLASVIIAKIWKIAANSRKFPPNIKFPEKFTNLLIRLQSHTRNRQIVNLLLR